jgi:hypothetical protein
MIFQNFQRVYILNFRRSTIGQINIFHLEYFDRFENCYNNETCVFIFNHLNKKNNYKYLIQYFIILFIYFNPTSKQKKLIFLTNRSSTLPSAFIF